MRHSIDARDFEVHELEALFALAGELEVNQTQSLKGKILASLFYEPSTRTRLSFESAMIRLGGNVITTENAKEFSSAIKGETLEDTIKMVSTYADVIALRHFEEGAALRAAQVSTVPIINAGDGAGQHPTQALLDLYTITRECGNIHGIKIAFVGDLKNGRTVRSLCHLLGKYKDVHIDFISPRGLQMRDDVKVYLRNQNVLFAEHTSFADCISQVDVVYQTRIQKERFDSAEEYVRYRGAYILTVANTASMKTGAVIMHPLPRAGEIDPALDTLPKAAYFRQAHYGLLVRMALLQTCVLD